MEYLTHPLTYLKAIIGTLLALIGAVQATLEALPDGSSWGDITTLGWVIIAGVTVTTFGAIYGVANASLPGGSANPVVEPTNL
jgi:hypothetical protein